MSYGMDNLTRGSGYLLFENLIHTSFIDTLCKRLHSLYPVRASSSNKTYAEREAIKELPDISVWWSQTTINWGEVQNINSIIFPYIDQYLPNAKFYASDIVTIEPHSTWINPHVDTPHRFLKYNYDQRFLGIQVIVALQDMDKDSGSTGFVPNSQLNDYDIKQCYRGKYDDYFLQNVKQLRMSKGSVLMYNSRLLHSSMPNPTDSPRPALLLHYMNNDIIEDVKNIDNVWKSNDIQN